MSLTLLRQHIEAVWGVRLPALAPGDQDALPDAPPDTDGAEDDAVPGWALYWAETAHGAVRVWRPDVSADRRAALLAHASADWARGGDASGAGEVRHEVALALAAPATLTEAAAGRVARRLDAGDALSDDALIEQFDPGETAYYANPARAPVVGVVEGGILACIAHSSRRTHEACELGINTRPEARRRGFALAATVLWTTGVQAESLIPLYSAFAANTASLALARAAGYRPFAHALYLKA